MKIAYTSDLHMDFYTSSVASSGKNEKLIETYVLKGERPNILILAGDISHYTVQVLQVCKELNNMGIKVIIISGNHEFYNISVKQERRYINLFDKVNELKMYLKDLPDTYFLDGECVEIEGVKFGGAMGWYDGSYYYKMNQGMYTEDILTHWKSYLNDFHRIPGLKDFRDLFKIEIEKIKNALAQKPDIMISHMCPVSEAIAVQDKFKFDKGSGYYMFDGLHLVDDLHCSNPPKYWVHGHMHDSKEFEIYKTKFIRNPLGYPRDNTDFSLKYLDV